MEFITARFYQKSLRLVGRLDRGIKSILFWWVVIGCALCGFKVAFAEQGLVTVQDQLQLSTPYLLLVAAPVASMLLALSWFSREETQQPQFRLAVLGRWEAVPRSVAETMPLYGASGFMASLLLGLLINVPLRSGEFIAALPAMSAEAPDWFRFLFTFMLADAVLLTSLYTIAFVAALRHAACFPRLLVTVWALDLAMQVAIGWGMTLIDGVPAEVSSALEQLLSGNLKKVLISIAIWLPYLMFSKRVNITYRNRIRIS